MMTKPTRRQMITAAVAMLAGGVLASTLPHRLMSEFGLSPEAARGIAEAALREWRGRDGGTEKPGE